MIKVSVMYPNGDDPTFDMEYYKTAHMEIVDRTMQPSRWEIESGMDGPYIAIGNLYFESMEAMQAGMGGAGEALADIPNFTKTGSAVQVSQIVEA
ncbi:EthD family reductase [Ilumatobacter sp.]|uniref:EthD family reductase n=1 Tax=Ilumatobacter sp. TaxID=1967498 RepID=UPI00375026EB